jgi:hypothetical protein
MLGPTISSKRSDENQKVPNAKAWGGIQTIEVFKTLPALVKDGVTYAALLLGISEQEFSLTGYKRSS